MVVFQRSVRLSYAYLTWVRRNRLCHSREGGNPSARLTPADCYILDSRLRGNDNLHNQPKNNGFSSFLYRTHVTILSTLSTFIRKSDAARQQHPFSEFSTHTVCIKKLAMPNVKATIAYNRMCPTISLASFGNLE